MTDKDSSFHVFSLSLYPLQVRTLSADNTEIPQWSEPVHLNITHLPTPVLTTADLVSTTLEVEDSEHNIIATVNMNWERPFNHKNLDVLEAWVGSRSLGEFEEPDLFQGDIVAFEVRIAKHKCCSSASDRMWSCKIPESR